MSVKISGANYKRFFADTSVWQKGAWFDEALTVVNGVEYGFDDDLNEEIDIADEDEVVVHGGVFYPTEQIDSYMSYEAVLRKWLKNQTVETLVVEVHKDKVEEIRKLLKGQEGVKVR